MLYRQLGEAEQAALREELGTLFHLLETTTASTWVPLGSASTVLEKVAQYAFRGHPNPGRLLGRGMAEHNLNVVYRTLLSIAGPRRALTQYARIWRLYHREGRVEILEPQKQSVVLSVSGHSHMPDAFRESTSGWIERALELVGATKAWSIVDDSALPIYRWRIRWQEKHVQVEPERRDSRLK